jgi:hypothetical protein
MVMKKNINRGTQIIIIGIIAAFSILGFVAYSRFYFEIGFPLDDAWIHQTYARNLVMYGEWAFIPGKISAGSTSPLWTILLTPAYFLGISPLVWTYFVGWLLLWGMGLISSSLFGHYCPDYQRFSIWVGIGMVLEWHLVWAAVSGMETLLFSLMILLTFLDVKIKHNNWLIRGLLAGISIWVRPDGIVLFFPLLVLIYFSEKNHKSRIIASMQCVLGIAILFIPYLGFNKYLAGDWWPNTFYAKQTEYAIMREAPIISRFFKEFTLPLVGAGILLLPGFLLFVYRMVKSRQWDYLAPTGLFLGYVGLYALRLPVTYQHGRYIIPVMALFFLMGITGLFKYAKTASTKIIGRVLYKAGVISGWIVLIMFWGLGARAYGKDVGFIQSEMVATAQWIEANTSPDSVVAAHDIGALGYWGNRNILDLAGLISPEVIPFIRDEHKIRQYLDNHRVDYFVTFPGWYPYLSSIGEKIYQSNGHISLELGGENMTVYRWLLQP